MAERASTDALVALSRWIDAGQPVTRDPEAVTWGRIAKLTEESGEVVAAFIGATGQNPRKGVTHTIADVGDELLDVAITALGAYEHLTQHQGLALRRLDDKIVAVAARAGVLGETLALPARAAPSSEVCGGCGRPMTEACGVESVRTVAERAARTAQADVPEPTSPVEDREVVERVLARALKIARGTEVAGAWSEHDRLVALGALDHLDANVLAGLVVDALAARSPQPAPSVSAEQVVALLNVRISRNYSDSWDDGYRAAAADVARWLTDGPEHYEAAWLARAEVTP
ncbi:MAG: MazG-like family protein [Cellulomonas sp.]|nr:MazG-like family protein [Cellulomonas sp.]MCR6649734.1 MazG-like family protein [Cellulomonas sp.]